MIYIIGSLRNPKLTEVSAALRAAGHECFDSWRAAHPEADDNWRDYEKAKGLTYVQALQDYAAQHVFNFDKHHLERADTVVLVYPAGKSGHLELGWALGRGKRGYILLDGEPERWDVMLAFADGVFTDVKELVAELQPKPELTRDFGSLQVFTRGQWRPLEEGLTYDIHAGEQ